MSEQVEVLTLPACDICMAERRINIFPASYDGKLKDRSSWAYMCEIHWLSQGIGRLGTGYGQKLILKKKEEEMHTFSHENVTIHHNGDNSGDAIVRVETETNKGVVSNELRIPCEALVNFARARTIDEIISKLEEMQ